MKPESDVKFKYRRPPLPPLGYKKVEGGTQPGFVYCGGFMDEMETDKLGKKIEDYVTTKKHPIVRFDYSDLGGSVWKTMSAPGSNLFSPNPNQGLYGCMYVPPVDGVETTNETTNDNDTFTDELKVQTSHLDASVMSFDHWVEDINSVLDDLSEGQPQILVGYDMGAWIAILAAASRPEKVAGVIGISSCFDFMPRLMKSLDADKQKEIMESDKAHWFPDSHQPNNYVVTKKLLEESKNHHLLDKKGKIPVKCPVRFIHLFRDPRAPYADLMHLIEKLETTDTEVETVNRGEREMDSDARLATVCDTIEALLSTFQEKQKEEERKKKEAEEKQKAKEEEERRKQEELRKEQERKRQQEEEKKKKLEDQARTKKIEEEKRKIKEAERVKKKTEKEVKVAKVKKPKEKTEEVLNESTDESKMAAKVAEEKLKVLKLKRDYYQQKINKLEEK